MSRNRLPKDLADTVTVYLRAQKRRTPALRWLVELFETLFFASLQTEEGEPITCHCVFLDPKKPNPHPPKRIVRDYWNCVGFSESIPLTVPNLTKLAKATDPRTSSLAVYPNGRQIQIWGLVDQGNSYHQFASYESDSGMPRPGLFQAGILGIGHLVAYDEGVKIAELKANSLITRLVDAFWSAPVLVALDSVIASIVSALRAETQSLDLDIDWNYWEAAVCRKVIGNLCRLLNRIQSFRHGGAILITPDHSLAHLKTKYATVYPRFRTSIEHLLLGQIQQYTASDEINNSYLDDDAETIPAMLYLDEICGRIDADESSSEIDGTLWFIALLSRVDGCVVLTPDFTIRGFGVEITCSDKPEAVYIAGDRGVSRSSLKPASYEHFGTRHRSMMRYCDKVPGSMGIVVSQDGDVRVIMKVEERLVVWDNIKLQLYGSPTFSTIDRNTRTTRNAERGDAPDRGGR
jgi:hypothetical protein